MSEALPRTEFDLYRGGTDRRLERLENRQDELGRALETALRAAAMQREGDLKAGTDALAKAISDYDNRRKEELQTQEKTRDRSWQRTLGIAGTMCALVAAWYEILSHIR